MKTLYRINKTGESLLIHWNANKSGLTSIMLTDDEMFAQTVLQLLSAINANVTPATVDRIRNNKGEGRVLVGDSDYVECVPPEKIASTLSAYKGFRSREEADALEDFLVEHNILQAEGVLL